MSEVQKEVLSYRLMRSARAGCPLRADLTHNDFKTLQQLRTASGRTYADIFRIIFYLYSTRPGLFDGPVIRHEKLITINFRAPRRWASILKDKAWEEGVSRTKYLGHLVTKLFSQFPQGFLAQVLTYQLDRVCRIVWMKSEGDK